MKLDLAFDSEHRRGDVLDLTLTVNIAEGGEARPIFDSEHRRGAMLDLTLTVNIAEGGEARPSL